MTNGHSLLKYCISVNFRPHHPVIQVDDYNMYVKPYYITQQDLEMECQ